MQIVTKIIRNGAVRNQLTTLEGGVDGVEAGIASAGVLQRAETVFVNIYGTQKPSPPG
jgi:hypothetical protein